MKSVILTIVIAISLFLIQRQNNIPEAVKSAFNSKYPTATSAKWEVEEKEYEVEFKLSGQEMEAAFDAKGTWLETEIEINKKDLPEAVQSAIASQFSGYKIEERQQLSTPQWAIAFEVELEKDKSTIEVVFSPTGVVLKKEKEEDDD